MKSVVLIASLAFTGIAAAGPPPLPVPHTNNAVAAVESGGNVRLYSFMGLNAGKAQVDISRQAYEYDPHGSSWRRIPDVPVASGRLASVAVGLGGKVYLFGGYTVAANGDEKSTPEVLQLDPASWRYTARAPIPVPVDDSVALPYAGRYIYLVSGWHDTGNSALVQVYDSVEDRWFKATDWPGRPVFGHAGGIVGNHIVIADGVGAVRDEQTGRNRFALSGESWLGEIDLSNPATIVWRKLPSHPGKPRYRMAAAGSAGRIIFAGGSDVAYNYNGQGYDGTPAPASTNVFAYDVEAQSWSPLPDKPRSTMDHRGLVEVGGKLFTIGGMDDSRTVIGEVSPVAP